MTAQTPLQFAVSCADDGVIQSWRFAPETQRLELLQQIDCAGGVGSLTWRAETGELHAAVRSAPYRLIHLRADADRLLHVTGETALPADMAYVGFDAGQDGFLCASYRHAQIAWLRRDGVQMLPTQGAAHACLALGGGRLIVATEVQQGNLLCLRGDSPMTPLAERELVRLRWHAESSPRHIACAGSLVFVDHEEHNRVDVCRYVETGNTIERLFSAALPFPGAERPWYADIRCSPDGDRIWVSERRHGVVHCFKVDLSRELLMLEATLHAPAVPRGIAQMGGYLLACGEGAAEFVLWRQAPDGVWSEAARARCGRRPVWAEFLYGDMDRRSQRSE